MVNNRECLIYILQTHGDKLTTADIIKFAIEYPKLCSGCKSGSDVILVGMILLEEGIIKREVAKGGFRWSLKK